MSDQIIFDVDGLIEAQIRQRDKDYAKVCCQNFKLRIRKGAFV